MKNNACLVVQEGTCSVSCRNAGARRLRDGPDRDPRDPLEDFNRAVYSFNDMLDRALVTPVAEGRVTYITPAPVNRGHQFLQQPLATCARR